MKPIESQWYDAGYKTARKETIDRVLEIIDAEHDSVTSTMIIDEEYVSGYTVLIELRKAVKALKGGE